MTKTFAVTPAQVEALRAKYKLPAGNSCPPISVGFGFKLAYEYDGATKLDITLDGPGWLMGTAWGKVQAALCV